MNISNTEKLYKIAPILYQQHDLDMSKTCMCWGFECPDTWFSLLMELSINLERINTDFLNKNIKFEIQAAQVKEKFGFLCFYYDLNYDYNNRNLYLKTINEIELLISNAEKQSIKICAICGKKASKYTTGWITYMCDSCYEKNKNMKGKIEDD